MKTLKNLLYILFSACILISCEDPNTTEHNGYEAPEPPATVVDGNLLTVEYYSRLNEENLFQTEDYNAIISHIAATSKPLAFFFDRSDATIGQTSPVVNMAWKAKMKSFFVQNETGQLYIQGTGIIVRPLIPVFNGIHRSDSLFLAGCTLMAPCNQPVTVVLSTCKISEIYQHAQIAEALGDSLKTNKIVIGTIATDQKESFKEYLKYHMTGFRLAFHTVSDIEKTYSLFILTPVNFVSRDIQELSIGGIPMYQCKIEYLN
jgi:hypothetical protein